MFVHNIGVKPCDPSADVLFAFVFFCLHTRLLEELRSEGLLEEVPANNDSIIPQEEAQGSTAAGVPQFMDDLFIPLSDPDPVFLIDRVIRAAQVLDRVVAAFGFVIQYGEGKTEVSIVLRGPGKQASTKDSQGCGKRRQDPAFAAG